MLVGCANTTPARSVPHGAPTTPVVPVVLATANGRTVQILSIAPDKTTVLREVELPSAVAVLSWQGADPIVMLDHVPQEQCEMPEEFYKTAAEYKVAHAACQSDPAFDGVIGRVTARGFDPFAKLPESTWAGLAPPAEEQRPCVNGCWRMSIKEDGIYQGHCIAAFSADGMDICENWIEARIAWPQPAVVRPSKRVWSNKTFVVPPSLHVAITMVNVANDGDEARYELRCTLDGKTTTYPARDQLDRGMDKDVTWLTTDPVRFIAGHGHDGFIGWTDSVLYEGCEPRVIGEPISGPDDIVIADGAVYQRGRVIGHVDLGRLVTFAP